MRVRVPKTLWGRTALAAAAIAILGLFLAPRPIRPKRKIVVTAQQVALSLTDPSVDQVGALRFLGGVALSSEDDGFGGLSALSVQTTDGDTTLLGVTDQGDRFSARLLIQGDRLLGLDNASLEPLVDFAGLPITGKSLGDAESVARLPDGRVAVGFERRHRIWIYGPDITGRASALATPAALLDAPKNGGLESLASWPDGRLLAITEQLRTSNGRLAAFLLKDGIWASLEWTPTAPGFLPSDATVTPDGDLLVLERYWSAFSPTLLRSRIMRVREAAVQPGAVLQGEMMAELTAPLITENFEGISAIRTAEGRIQLFLVSDDNFTRAQRTLLLWFELR